MLAKSFIQRKTAFIFSAALLAVFLFFGSPDNHSFFQFPQNYYKISQDAVTICNELKTLSPQGSVELCIQLDSENAFSSGDGLDGSLYYGIRTFESRFKLQHLSISPEKCSMSDFHLTDLLAPDLDYYICPKVETVYRELERLGYVYVSESEHFAIFKNTKDES